MHCIYWDSCITEVDAPWSALTQSFLCHAEGVDGTEDEETSDAFRLGCSDTCIFVLPYQYIVADVFCTISCC